MPLEAALIGFWPGGITGTKAGTRERIVQKSLDWASDWGEEMNTEDSPWSQIQTESNEGTPRDLFR
jgi:hypothetical protein